MRAEEDAELVNFSEISMRLENLANRLGPSLGWSAAPQPSDSSGLPRLIQAVSSLSGIVQQLETRKEGEEAAERAQAKKEVCAQRVTDARPTHPAPTLWPSPPPPTATPCKVLPPTVAPPKSLNVVAPPPPHACGM